MHAAAPDPATLPFQETTQPEYAEAFIALGIDQEPVAGGGVILYGRCPRCRASITVPLPDGAVKSVAEAQLTPAPPAAAPPAAAPPPSAGGQEAEYPIACTCTQCDHSGRPAEYPDGCGAYWLLAIAPEET